MSQFYFQRQCGVLLREVPTLLLCRRSNGTESFGSDFARVRGSASGAFRRRRSFPRTSLLHCSAGDGDPGLGSPTGTSSTQQSLAPSFRPACLWRGTVSLRIRGRDLSGSCWNRSARLGHRHSTTPVSAPIIPKFLCRFTVRP